jgi:hypothetical protein
MSILKNAIEQKKFDSRVVEKNVNRGRVERSEVEVQLKNLPDDEANAEWVEISSLSSVSHDDDTGSDGSADSTSFS